MRTHPDRTQRISHSRSKVPQAGPKEDTTLQIDVTFATSQGGADVYNVIYQVTTDERTAEREFEVRYAGEPVTVVDNEYCRLEFRPPVPR